MFCPLRAISSIPVATLNDGRIYTRDELFHIRQADYSSKYKSEEEFCSIIRLDILCWLHDGCFGVEEPNCGNKETSPSLRQKTVCVPSRYNKETRITHLLARLEDILADEPASDEFCSIIRLGIEFKLGTNHLSETDNSSLM